MQFVTIRVISVSVATVACAICCSLSILAADEEAGEEGEDSSAGLPEKYAKDYLIVRSTISPDKKFAVIYPNAAMEDAADQKGTEIKNYLVRLEPFAVLKVLDVDRPYFEHRSNSGISAEWSEHSSVALITIDSKWGPGDVVLAEFRNPFHGGCQLQTGWRQPGRDRCRGVRFSEVAGRVAWAR